VASPQCWGEDCIDSIVCLVHLGPPDGQEEEVEAVDRHAIVIRNWEAAWNIRRYRGEAGQAGESGESGGETD
jgi:hypothetical protein